MILQNKIADKLLERKASYRNVMKATSLFGGVQVFNILVRIVKSKFIALLLGPNGMGIAGLLESTTSTIMNISSFGLGISAVKSVAEANTSGDEKRISLVISVLHRCVWATGILGTAFTLILSQYLSKLTFGSTKYSVAFVWLSITLLVAQLSIGQNVVMQGLRKLSYLAKANLIGALLGLFFSVPIYYFFGVDGIVPAIIASSLSTLGLSWYYSNKVGIKKRFLTLNETIKEGKPMFVMGFLVSVNGIIVTSLSYVIKIYIARKGGIEQVGLYTAGFAIINTYVGMIFTAMATDYFPRLCGVANDNHLVRTIINQQAEMAVIILAPILIVFVVFIHWVIILLYSSSFSGVDGMIQWAAIGMFFKAASWPVAYVFVAKGDNKTFIINELIANAYVFILNMLGYIYFGLEGLGFSFLIGYCIYFVQLVIVSKVRYKFYFYSSFSKIFSIQFLFSAASLCAVRFLPSTFFYFAGGIIIIFSTIYSFSELNKRIGILELIIKIIKRTQSGELTLFK
jgi:O-antigen/teichoic acid export membrane protein